MRKGPKLFQSRIGTSLYTSLIHVISVGITKEAKNGTDHGCVCSNVTAAKINQKSLLAHYLENYELQEWLLSWIQTPKQMPTNSK